MTTFFDSPAQLVAACTVAALAQVVYVLFGFGSGLVMVAGLALLVPDLRDVVVLVLLVNVPVEVAIVVRSRRAIDWSGVLRLAVGIAIGIPLGAAVLSLGNPDLLMGALGIAVVATGIALTTITQPRPAGLPRWLEPITGVISGTLTGLFGTGGPPLVVHHRLSGRDKHAFRGNLMALFLVMTAIRLPTYVLGGLITAPRLGAALAVMPAVLAGAWIGDAIHVSIPEHRFHRGAAFGLVVVGLVLVVRAAR
jgi:uncharacterized membrane protein YfcA